MSLVPTTQNQVLQKHLESRVSTFLGLQHLKSKVSTFLGLQLRDVEICCFVAFSGKVVSDLHGLREP